MGKKKNTESKFDAAANLRSHRQSSEFVSPAVGSQSSPAAAQDGCREPSADGRRCTNTANKPRRRPTWLPMKQVLRRPEEPQLLSDPQMFCSFTQRGRRSMINSGSAASRLQIKLIWSFASLHGKRKVLDEQVYIKVNLFMHYCRPTSICKLKLLNQFYDLVEYIYIFINI